MKITKKNSGKTLGRIGVLIALVFGAFGAGILSTKILSHTPTPNAPTVSAPSVEPKVATSIEAMLPPSAKPMGASTCAGSPSGLKDISELPEMYWDGWTTSLYIFGPAFGPGVIDEGGWPSCYAPNTMGAVAQAYAVMNAFAARPTQAEVYKRYGYKDDMYDYAMSQPPKNHPPYDWSVLGFKTEVISDTFVKVHLLMRMDTRGQYVFILPMKWQEQNWKMQILPIQGAIEYRLATEQDSQEFFNMAPRGGE